MERLFITGFFILMLAFCAGCVELKLPDATGSNTSARTDNPPSPADFNPVDITPSYLSLDPANAHAMTVDGNCLYMGSFKGIEVFDITDRRNPKWISNIELPRGVYEFSIDGDMACAVGGDRSFTLVDISDPASARVINACPTQSGPYCAALDDSLVYIGGVNRMNMDETAQLEIYDITDPMLPVQLMSAEVDDRINDIFLTDEYIYLAAGADGLIIRENNPGGSFMEVGRFPTERADGVAVDGDYAWVTDESGIRVVDISNPSSPRDAGYLGLNGIPRKVLIRSGYAFVGDYNHGVHICELDPPDSITRTALIERVSEFMTFAMSGDFVYVPYRFGISVYDVSRPDSPEEVGLYPVPGECQAFCMSGEYAYSMDYYGFRVIDIDPPESAHVVGFLATEPLYRFNSLIFSDNRVYANVQSGGVRIFNVENPSEPVLEYETQPDTAKLLAVIDGLAYYTDSTAALGVVDMIFPQSRRIICNLQMPGAIVTFEVRGDLAYVECPGYLKLLDVSNPADPQIVNTIEFPWDLLDVDDAGWVAYAIEKTNAVFPSVGMSTADYKLLSIDISALNSGNAARSGAHVPGVLDSVDYGKMGFSDCGGDVAGDYLYIVIGGYLDIYDISSPDDLIKEKSYAVSATPSPLYSHGASEIHVDRGYAWLDGMSKILKLW
jgi:hypothetical protein